MDSDKKPRFFRTTEEVLARPIREHLFTVILIAALAILARIVEPSDLIKELFRFALISCVVLSVMRYLQLKRRWRAKQSETNASEDQTSQ